jgi:hypothetical protein
MNTRTKYWMKMIFKIYVWVKWKIWMIRSVDHRKDEMHKKIWKLSENLYFECYLTIIYLLNKTFIVRLKWNSSLITLRKCLNKSIKWELSNLKVFDNKTYVLLKDSDALTRSEKLKTRAFVKYLVEYDWINIFRVWYFEKWNVSDYRDVILWWEKNAESRNDQKEKTLNKHHNR